MIQDPENEFKDILQKLEIEARKERLEMLLAKARMGELVPAENETLKQLLAAQHGI